MNQSILRLFFGSPCMALTTRLARFALYGHKRLEKDGYAVYPEAKLFQAGDYPGKGPDGATFSVTLSDLALRVAKTRQLEANLEHVDFDDPQNGALTALKGEVGFGKNLHLDAKDPSWVIAEVWVPDWLDPKLQNKGVSVEIPFAAGEEFSGYALTYTPHVEGAALMSDLVATFAATKTNPQTWHGQAAIQEAHDHAARHGAICTPSDGTKMTTKKEHSAIQTVHDAALAGGASCRMMSDRPSYYSANESPAPAGQEEDMDDATFDKKATGWLSRFFSGQKPEKPEEKPAENSTAPLVSFKDTAEFRAQQDEIAALKAQIETITATFATQKAQDEKTASDQAAQFATDNTAKIEDYCQGGRLTPADKANFKGTGKTAEAVRAQDTVVFDALMALVTPNPLLARPAPPTITGEAALANVGQTPEVAQYEATRNGLKAVVTPL